MNRIIKLKFYSKETCTTLTWKRIISKINSNILITEGRTRLCIILMKLLTEEIRMQ